MDNLFIKVKYLEMVQSVIKQNYPNAVIWAYGSRAFGNEYTAHHGSDLDLCVKCFGSENGNIARLREAFTESNIPFLVDIFEFDRLPKQFQAEIEKKHIVIYPL